MKILGLLLLTSSNIWAASLTFDTFMGLGTLGGNHSTIDGISPDGRVAIGTSTDANGDPQAFRWTLGLGMEGLGFLNPGSPKSIGLAGTQNGSVIIGESTNVNGKTSPFKWTAGGGMVDASPDPTIDVRINDISADGSITIGTQGGVGGIAQAYRRVGNGPTEHIPNPINPGTFINPNNLSNDGTVISGFLNNTSNNLQAFRLIGTTLDLLPSGGAQSSTARGISGDGSTIVGQKGGFGVTEAFYWTQATGTVGLGLWQGKNTTALEVSGDGSVIVGGAIDEVALVWDQASGFQDFQALLVGLGLGPQLAGWTLQAAVAISDDARTIVGYGLNPQGDQEAWIATTTVPEPATWWLLGSGMLGVFCYRRRQAGC